jgi:hypothetical protein
MIVSLPRSLHISHKLILMSLSLILPLGVLLYYTVSGINHHIRFAELELHGNAYQRPLEDLLRVLPTPIPSPPVLGGRKRPSANRTHSGPGQG